MTFLDSLIQGTGYPTQWTLIAALAVVILYTLFLGNKNFFVIAVAFVFGLASMFLILKEYYMNLWVEEVTTSGLNGWNNYWISFVMQGLAMSCYGVATWIYSFKYHRAIEEVDNLASNKQDGFATSAVFFIGIAAMIITFAMCSCMYLAGQIQTSFLDPSTLDPLGWDLTSGFETFFQVFAVAILGRALWKIRGFQNYYNCAGSHAGQIYHFGALSVTMIFVIIATIGGFFVPPQDLAAD